MPVKLFQKNLFIMWYIVLQCSSIHYSHNALTLETPYLKATSLKQCETNKEQQHGNTWDASQHAINSQIFYALPKSFYTLCSLMFLNNFWTRLPNNT